MCFEGKTVALLLKQKVDGITGIWRNHRFLRNLKRPVFIWRERNDFLWRLSSLINPLPQQGDFICFQCSAFLHGRHTVITLIQNPLDQQTLGRLTGNDYFSLEHQGPSLKPKLCLLFEHSMTSIALGRQDRLDLAQVVNFLNCLASANHSRSDAQYEANSNPTGKKAHLSACLRSDGIPN